jgi:hypothetical protein
MDSVPCLEGFNGFNAFLVQAKGACAEEVSQEFAQNRRGKLAALESPVKGIDQSTGNVPFLLLNSHGAIGVFFHPTLKNAVFQLADEPATEGVIQERSFYQRQKPINDALTDDLSVRHLPPLLRHFSRCPPQATSIDSTMANLL